MLGTQIRYFKWSCALVLIQIFVCLNVFADTSGSGCRIDNKVYTVYMGEAYPYGPSSAKKKYYKNTSYITIYPGYGYNQHQGYKCGFINIYPASNYWNGSSIVQIPAENEITSSVFSACVLASTLGATPLGDGNYVKYTYNRTNKCSAPTGVPLDDYAGWLLLAIGSLGAWSLTRLNTQSAKTNY